MCDRNTLQWQNEEPHSIALETQPQDRSDMTYICNFRVQELHSVNMGAVLRQDMAQLLPKNPHSSGQRLSSPNQFSSREGWIEG